MGVILGGKPMSRLLFLMLLVAIVATGVQAAGPAVGTGTVQYVSPSPVVSGSCCPSAITTTVRYADPCPSGAVGPVRRGFPRFTWRSPRTVDPCPPTVAYVDPCPPTVVAAPVVTYADPCPPAVVTTTRRSRCPLCPSLFRSRRTTTTYVAPAPTVQYVSPAPTVQYVAPACPTVCPTPGSVQYQSGTRIIY